MTSYESTLHFHQPPVVEVAIGVETGPIVGWDVPHFGAFWQTIREAFPRFQVQPALPPTGAGAGFVSSTFPIRCIFIDASDTKLIQVQHDRLIYNWRKIKDADAYSSYEQLKGAFLSELGKFRSFLVDMDLAPPSITRCEVTYVDHFPGGASFESLHEPDAFSKLFRGPLKDYLAPAQPQQLGATYVLPDAGGSVSLVLQPVLRALDQKHVSQLVTTVRLPTGPPGADISQVLDQAHDWAVRAFLEFSSDEAKSQWGPKEGLDATD
jgi:uncharacterized protein (TIGR04255 family)